MFFNLKRKKKESVPNHMGNEHWLFYNGRKMGPFSREDIQRMLWEAKISSNAMIKSCDTWVMLKDVAWIVSGEDVSNKSTSAFVPSEQELNDTEVACPHCWHLFRMSQINYISRHVELTGDTVLGPEAQKRFLPTSFNEQGYAIDARGIVCQDMACPRCHLRIPEAMIDISSCLFSIVGAPASGKSYFLTAMIWQLRDILAKKFDYTLADTDAVFNAVLNRYQSILFLNRQTDQYVALPKTELQGNDFSHQILLDGMSVDLPLPFVFTLTPMHPASEDNFRRNIVFYDNAGEHFEPGRDNVTNLATLHLAHSNGILFLFDPLKDTRLVTQCNPDDPQAAQVDSGTNQLILLNEMILRIRKYEGVKGKNKYQKPLIVIVPKYDCWKEAFSVDLAQQKPWYYSERRMKYYLELGTVFDISFRTRELLLQYSPEIVTTSEAFFSTVYFLPASSLGRMPQYDPQKGMIAILPKDLNPIWAEVPMLVQLWHAGLVDGVLNPPAKGGIEITNYKIQDDDILYTLPGCRERECAPSCYSGKTVFSTKLGKYIKFPDISAQSITPPSDADDGSFWD